MGASLGSDVPFFLRQTTAALVTGRGEQIEPLDSPDFSLVLINPGFPSDTAAAFRLLDDFRENTSRQDAKTPRLRRDKLKISVSPRLRINSSGDCFNDFLPVFGEREKAVYNGIISQFYELGADFASLSGAGSTCFGVFKDEIQARKAAEYMKNSWDFVQFCRPLANSPLLA
jgi:4-diphosphocytidyl-2-C-methyl-D-erythritol kinase